MPDSDPDLREGDRQLAALLRAHGCIMNGGVFHVVECLSPEELEAAKAGYLYFGFDHAPGLLDLARDRANADDFDDADENEEAAFELAWSRNIPDDAALSDAFRRKLAESPESFAPV